MFKLMFYWFLVSIGLNFGLIPEEHAAMTAEEINRSVVQDSGRTDLCVDYAAGDFAPTTRALEMMNEAQQFLDRLYRNRGSEDCHTVDVAVGDYQIDVPNIRHVTRMDMTATDGTRHELRRRTYPFMREQYGESFDLIDVGQPVDWARAIGENVAGAEKIENGDFTTDLTDWTAGPGWAWDAGVAKFTYDDIGSSISQLFTNQSLSGNTLRFDATLSAGAILTIQFWGITGFPAPIFVTYDNITESGSYEIPLPPITRAGLAFTCLSIGAVVTLDNVSLATDSEADYIFLPPADEAYTLCVYGGYYNTAFEDGTDISWWSDTYPSILMMAYRMVIERHFHANETRVAYWMKQIALESKQLQIDLVAEETTNAPKYMRRMPSAVARRHLT